MEKQFSQVLGNTLIVLSIAGVILPSNRKHLLGLLNVDVSHSVLRVPLTMALLYAASNADLKTTRTILMGVGIFYVGMGAVGLADRRAGGALPSGLTTFDIVYHFGVGAAAIWMGSRSGRMMKP